MVGMSVCRSQYGLIPSRRAARSPQAAAPRRAACRAAFTEDRDDAGTLVGLELCYLSAQATAMRTPVVSRCRTSAWVRWSSSRGAGTPAASALINNASHVPSSLHKASFKVAQILGGFGRDRRARRALDR